MKKRAFDLVVVSLAAIVWVPVVLLAALTVLIFSGRPVCYRSKRWVRAGSAVEMLKLRVMVPDADRTPDHAAGDRFLNTVAGSALYTPVGRVLDRLGLNEIPQCLHVLRGEMSIVGPRPLTNNVRGALIEEFGDIDARWSVSPAGLTGLPQLVGRSALTDLQRLELEYAYSQMVTRGYRLRTDFTILLYTVLITFRLKKPLSVDAALALAYSRRTAFRLLSETARPTLTTQEGDADVAV